MRNKKHKEYISSGIFILIIIVFVVFFVVTNWRIAKRRAELKDRVTLLQQELQVLEEKNKELNDRKDDTETDDIIEKVAREQLELKKPGEEVVVIQKEEPKKGEVEEEEKSWWDWIKSIWTRD